MSPLGGGRGKLPEMSSGKQADDLFGAIRNLPVPEQLRLVERVVHDIAESEKVGPSEDAMSLIGSFSDVSDLVEQVCEAAMVSRERDPLRLDRG
jgi:hypothetical protein